MRRSKWWLVAAAGVVAACGGDEARAPAACDDPRCEEPVDPAPAPILLLVQDRSTSMDQCMAGPGIPGASCTSDEQPAGGASRMDRVGEAFGRLASETAGSVAAGLVVAGGPGDDEICGAPALLAAPASGSNAAVAGSYHHADLFDPPAGRTPLAAALDRTASLIFDEEGALRAPERRHAVVIVTDGIADCADPGLLAGCRCAWEEGCPADDGGTVAFDERGILADGRACADGWALPAQIDALTAAGVETTVVLVGQGGESAAARYYREVAVERGAALLFAEDGAGVDAAAEAIAHALVP